MSLVEFCCLVRKEDAEDTLDYFLEDLLEFIRASAVYPDMSLLSIEEKKRIVESVEQDLTISLAKTRNLLNIIGDFSQLSSENDNNRQKTPPDNKN